jgi:hypothetical protein
MFHGRWAAVKTTTHYLQSGFAAHVATTLPTPAWLLVKTFAAALPELLDAYRHWVEDGGEPFIFGLTFKRLKRLVQTICSWALQARC